MFATKLEEKQAFWQTQKLKFEKEYIFSSHFDFLFFDLDHGNYVVKYVLEKELHSEALDAFHRVNTGWTMWKKAIQIKQEDLNNIENIPEGYIVIPSEQAKDSERLEFLLNNPTLEPFLINHESCVGIISRCFRVYEIFNKLMTRDDPINIKDTLRDAIDKAMHEHNPLKNIDYES